MVSAASGSSHIRLTLHALSQVRSGQKQVTWLGWCRIDACCLSPRTPPLARQGQPPKLEPLSPCHVMRVLGQS